MRAGARLTLLCCLLALAAAVASRGRARAQGAGSPHGSLSLECSDCHSAQGWTPLPKPTRFRHGQSGFALEGAHARTGCRSCHQSLVFDRVGSACADCHRDPHQGELGPRCDTCHTVQTWSNQREMFRVHNRTRFPLFAVHATLACEDCHGGQRPSQYTGTPTDCGACHAARFEASRDPNHVEAGFSRRCEECHRVTARDWRPAAYQHPPTPLVSAAHGARARCSDCHATGFANAPRECVGCHRDDFVATTAPPHASAAFSTDCAACHQLAAWKPASFRHEATRFPLTGAHQAVGCDRCHAGGRFTGTSSECQSCHQADYQRTTNPNHASAGFPMQCQNCHATAAWRPASSVDHNRTRFPLTGAHQRLSCDRCHVGGRFAGTSTDCVSCHRGDYDRAANPNHRSSGFPTQCQGCHSTNGWRPATGVDHSRTRFPLTGAHQGVSCDRCHAGGRFAGTPTDCVACHRSNYDRTTNPNHASAGFPVQCQNCHATSGWRPASFNHDASFFPIYSGKHRQAWSSCTDCHVAPGNYSVFECIRCHEHSNKAEVDNKHRQVSGYQYNSQACYRCHPRGSE
jgi:hypothetical protein